MRISYWSSDVCSSDLWKLLSGVEAAHPQARRLPSLGYSYTIEGVECERTDAEVLHFLAHRLVHGGVGQRRDRPLAIEDHLRSEERRVGKACVSTCSSRRSQEH